LQLNTNYINRDLGEEKKIFNEPYSFVPRLVCQLFINQKILTTNQHKKKLDNKYM